MMAEERQAQEELGQQLLQTLKSASGRWEAAGQMEDVDALETTWQRGLGRRGQSGPRSTVFSILGTSQCRDMHEGRE
jgi:hypothetical protein